MFPALSRDRQSALQYVKDYRPQTDGQQLRILLHGPVGAGKSSFINSVQSVLHDRMYAQALVDTFHNCFTKRVWQTFDCVDKENISNIIWHLKYFQTLIKLIFVLLWLLYTHELQRFPPAVSCTALPCVGEGLRRPFWAVVSPGSSQSYLRHL